MAPLARSPVEDAVRMAGINPADTDDLERLSKALRWALDRQTSQEELKRNRAKWLGAFILACIGGAGTIFVQWLSEHWSVLAGKVSGGH